MATRGPLPKPSLRQASPASRRSSLRLPKRRRARQSATPQMPSSSPARPTWAVSVRTLPSSRTERRRSGWRGPGKPTGRRLHRLGLMGRRHAEHSLPVPDARPAARHGVGRLGLAPGNNHSKGSTDDLTRTGASLGVMAQANAAQGNEASAKASSALPPRSASGSRRLRCTGTGRHHSRRRGRLVVVVSASDAPSACLDEFLWKRRQILRRIQHDGFVNSSC